MVVFEDASFATQTCEPVYGMFAVMTSNMVAILFHGFNKAFFLVVSLLNIHESKRFKKGVFRFWGCMPLYDKAAARAIGMSKAWIVRRAYELHNIAMGHVVVQN